MNNQDQYDLIDQADALESFRASDFDCYSAYGEVIDNSIQANASKIKISFIEKQDRYARQKQMGEVYFADNGEGMTTSILRKCLKLGYSTRKNDRKGIGRFGVGMTSGAINQCKRVEIYSKVDGGAWYYVYLDLDEVAEKKQKEFPIPFKKNPPDDKASFIKSQGTVVRWAKYDNQEFSYDQVVSESKAYFGRTYRRFIWGTAKNCGEVSIFVNDKEVNVIDPLYVNKSKTGFESEDKAELLEPSYYTALIPDDHDTDKQKSKIEINMSLLPESYRRESGMGGDSFAKERFIDKNEGISIMRNDREVFYGKIPYWTGLFQENPTRFIGIEISFNAEIDKLFKVKNIKRGALPYGKLNQDLKELIIPTLRTYLEIIKTKWENLKKEKEKENEESNQTANVSSRHNETNTLLKQHNKELLKGDKNKKIDNKIIARLVLEDDANDAKIKEVINSLKENGITIDEKVLVGNSFLDIKHGNGLKTLIYNTNSTFYKAYDDILNELKTKDNKLAENYKVLIDLIFVGYMLAESKVDPESEYQGDEYMDDIKNNWARELSKILRKWQN